MLINCHMDLIPGESHVSDWIELSLDEFVEFLNKERIAWAGSHIVAIDGRSGSGKTSLANTLRQAIPNSMVVHIDDVPSSGSWRGSEAQETILTAPLPDGCSYFVWTACLLENIVTPYRTGHDVHYRPEAWDDWGRGEGAIEVPLTCSTLILEGVGAGRRELVEVVDTILWIQADHKEARRRGIARDGRSVEEEGFWNRWEAQEIPFLTEQAPWERATAIVEGTSRLTATPTSNLIVSIPDIIV